jgi:elongation factor P hydroxylase
MKKTTKKMSMRRLDELFSQRARKYSIRYVRGFTVPRTIPAGRVLVHNHIVQAHGVYTVCGWNGFRAWTQKPSRKLEPCKCGWSGLVHYRVKARNK